MLTRRWLLKLGAALGGTLVAGSNEGCSSGGVAFDGDGGLDSSGPTEDARADTSPPKQICGYGYGAYGYGYGYGYGKYPDYGYGYGYGYGCYGYGAKWSSSLFRNRRMTRSGPLDVRDLARG